jgi:chemosensory pili system protein ChpE
MQLGIFAVTLALAYCVPPGPVLAEATRRGLASGFRAALAVELGSLAGDVMWVTVALVGAAALSQMGGLQTVIGTIGALFLLALGLRALFAARRKPTPAVDGRSAVEGAFATGAVLGVASPYALPFWLGVGSSLTGYGISSLGLLGYVIFCTAFTVVCVAYALVAAGAIAWGRRMLSPRFFFMVDIGCAAVLLLLGLRLLSQTLGKAVS